MEMYLLKFSACLLVFWLVYVFLLERHKMHYFKRFYLLGALALSLLIPKLTLTTYVEPVIADLETEPFITPLESVAAIEMPIEQSPLINLELTLWFIYGLVVLLLLFRFLVNLVQLYGLISKNENITRPNFIYVLLKEYRIPHSFFKYIFLNKFKFENKTIPKEVILHEETHAKQLHSLDIIVIELLQIVLWFHPLVYILKYHIKLNHEFLADQAVLKHGTNASNYQKLLLQFSSNTQNHQLASAINYSSIKKRFTVMKTQTSKTRIWFNSLLLLPIIAILFYSFAEKEYVVKENTLDLSQQNKEYTEQNPPTSKEVADYNAWAKKVHAESKPLSEDTTFFPPINEQDLIKFSEIYKRMSEQQKTQAVAYPFSGLDVNNGEHNYQSNPTTKQQIATEKQIAEYNTWAKPINEKMAKAKANNNDVNQYPIIKVKEVNKYKAIYAIMTATQKKVSEPWPSFPSPPPSPPLAPENSKGRSGPIEINGATYYFKQQIGKTTYYDQYGKVVDINKVPPPPPIPNDATLEQKVKMKKATDAYMKANPDKIGKVETTEGEIIEVIEIPDDLQGSVDINGETFYYTTSNGKTIYFDRYGKEVAMDRLPPPPPTPPKKNPSFQEYIINMEEKGASFFMDGKKITAEQAKNIAKNNKGKKVDMITQKDDNGQYLVKLSTNIDD